MKRYFLSSYIPAQVQNRIGGPLDLSPTLGLSVGPVFWSSFADIYGRRIIIITGTSITFIATIWYELLDYDHIASNVAARFFQSFGLSPAAPVGVAIVTELVVVPGFDENNS